MPEQRTFDRLVQFDERSRGYPIRALIPPTYKPRSYTWTNRLTLDQGSEGACVGFAWTHELRARPAVVDEVSEEFARDIYYKARRLDPWEGEDYEGTSILAGAKAVMLRGYMVEYRWAFGLEDLILAVGYKGPAVLGLNWYEGMFEPDPEGYIHPTGELAGGHAIMCNAVSIPKQRLLLHNSWGPEWGNNVRGSYSDHLAGTAWLSFDDARKLLAEDGEACIPVKRVRSVDAARFS